MGVGVIFGIADFKTHTIHSIPRIENTALTPSLSHRFKFGFASMLFQFNSNHCGGRKEKAVRNSFEFLAVVIRE